LHCSGISEEEEEEGGEKGKEEEGDEKGKEGENQVPDYKTQNQELHAVLQQRLKKGDTWCVCVCVRVHPECVRS